MSTTNSSEEKLIACAIRGDLEAFNDLVLSYQDVVYRYANMRTQDPDEADDITQETFIKAFQNIRSFRGGSFRGWLLKIATNLARDQWRRFRNHPVYSLFARDRDGEETESPDRVRDTAPAVETIAEQHETSAQLFHMLDELPEVYRSAITLIDLYELEYAEAAKILCIPIGTLKSRLARGRMQMIERIKSANDHELDLIDNVKRWEVLDGATSLSKEIQSTVCTAS